MDIFAWASSNQSMHLPFCKQRRCWSSLQDLNESLEWRADEAQAWIPRKRAKGKLKWGQILFDSLVLQSESYRSTVVLGILTLPQWKCLKVLQSLQVFEGNQEIWYFWQHTGNPSNALYLLKVSGQDCVSSANINPWLQVRAETAFQEL